MGFFGDFGAVYVVPYLPGSFPPVRSPRGGTRFCASAAGMRWKGSRSNAASLGGPRFVAAARTGFLSCRPTDTARTKPGPPRMRLHVFWLCSKESCGQLPPKQTPYSGPGLRASIRPPPRGGCRPVKGSAMGLCIRCKWKGRQGEYCGWPLDAVFRMVQYSVKSRHSHLSGCIGLVGRAVPCPPCEMAAAWRQMESFPCAWQARATSGGAASSRAHFLFFPPAPRAHLKLVTSLPLPPLSFLARPKARHRIFSLVTFHLSLACPLPWAKPPSHFPHPRAQSRIPLPLGIGRES